MPYCPRCAAEADDSQHYCRLCGVDLALVAKAVSLGDTISRSGNRSPAGAEAVDLEVDRASEDAGRAIERIGREIERDASERNPAVTSAMERREDRRRERASRKPPKDRRSTLLEQGAGGAAFGLAFTFILYYYAGDILARIPPETLARLPFDIVAWAPLLWLLGLFPLFGGIGNLVAGALTPAALPQHDALPPAEPAALPEPPLVVHTSGFEQRPEPASVTEHTTRSLDRDARAE